MHAASTATSRLTPEDELHWLALRLVPGLGTRRVVPMLMRLTSMSASRAPWMAADSWLSSSPRWAKVMARSVGPPTVRAWVRAAARSRPWVEVCATGVLVVGL